MFITLGDGFTVASIEAAHAVAAAAAAAAAKTDASQSSQQRAQSGREEFEGKWREWVKPGLVLDFAQRCGNGVIRFSCRCAKSCLVCAILLPLPPVPTLSHSNTVQFCVETTMRFPLFGQNRPKIGLNSL